VGTPVVGVLKCGHTCGRDRQQLACSQERGDGLSLDGRGLRVAFGAQVLQQPLHSPTAAAAANAGLAAAATLGPVLRMVLPITSVRSASRIVGGAAAGHAVLQILPAAQGGRGLRARDLQGGREEGRGARAHWHQICGSRVDNSAPQVSCGTPRPQADVWRTSRRPSALALVGVHAHKPLLPLTHWDPALPCAAHHQPTHKRRARSAKAHTCTALLPEHLLQPCLHTGHGLHPKAVAAGRWGRRTGIHYHHQRFCNPSLITSLAAGAP